MSFIVIIDVADVQTGLVLEAIFDTSVRKQRIEEDGVSTIFNKSVS